MSEVVVTPVRSRREQKQFVDLPWELYRDDPNWVPPIRQNLRELVGYARHPFHEIAEVQTFLARRDGKVVGRVAAILNRAHIETRGDNRGFFGFFESVNDQEVATGLLNAVAQWHQERGVPAVRGPMNPSLNYEVGLLVDGFDTPPVFMMSYNHPYYSTLIEGAGFRKTHDLVAYLGTLDQLPNVKNKLAPLAEMALEHSGGVIRPLDKKNFLKDVQNFLQMYNRSLVGMWGFVPMQDSEVRHMAASLQWLIIPDLALAVEVEGEMVGVVLGLPDFNPAIKASNGRLLPFGIMRMLQLKRHPKLVRVLSINVVPEYQRWGLGLSLMNALVPPGVARGVKEAEFSWVSETNKLARYGLEKAGARQYKTYRIYDNDLPDQPPLGNSPAPEARE